MSTLATGIEQRTPLSVSVARTVEEVESLREFWDAKVWHPRMDLDVFLEAHRSPSSTSRPYVVRVYRDASLVGILAGRTEETDFEVRLGYWTCWKARLRAITIPNAGVLGDFSIQNAQAACRYLQSALRRGDAEGVFFDWLPLTTEIFKVARSTPKIWWRNALFRPNVHCRVQLPAQAAELWNQSHHRRAWVRRIFKKIEGSFPAKVVFRFFSDIAEVETMCQDAERVAGKSYQRTLGVGFSYDEDTSQRLRQYAQLGILRGCILYVNEAPKSFWIGSVYKECFFSAYLAHDPGFDKFEPGSLVFIRMLERLCAEGVRQVDLGQGEGFYKQRFATQSDMEACLYMLSPSLRSLALNAGFSTGEAMAIAAKRALSGLNVLQSLKRKWRRQLIKKSENNGMEKARPAERGEGVV